MNEPVIPGGGDGLVRVRLGIAYDGTNFSGWASQPELRTVQGELTAVLTRLLRRPVALTVAGRTDAGVHATGQVAHFDVATAAWMSIEATIVRRLARILPPDIQVSTATVAPDGFDARFSALSRSYVYRISDDDAGVEPRRRFDTVAWRRGLDVELMTLAANMLLGEHDFAAYCRRREGATTVRGLLQLDVVRVSNAIEFLVTADAFCHSMVRSLVGGLTAVGDHRRPVAWPAELLALSERANDIGVAPAHGLTLVGVGYPPDGQLAAREAVTRKLRVLPSRD